MFSGLVLVLGFGGFCICLFSPELPHPPSNVKLAGFWNWVLLSFAFWKSWICTSMLLSDLCIHYSELCLLMLQQGQIHSCLEESKSAKKCCVWQGNCSNTKSGQSVGCQHNLAADGGFGGVLYWSLSWAHAKWNQLMFPSTHMGIIFQRVGKNRGPDNALLSIEFLLPRQKQARAQ